MEPDYNDSVFINCPFQDSYKPMLRAGVYAIYRCGFFPITALIEEDGTDNRLSKIERLIERCRYGVHDISNTELNANGLPSFNMPFELGIFFGAKKFGDKEQKRKVAIIFDREQYRYHEFISDLGGVDIRPHEHTPELFIRRIREFLYSNSKRTTIPGHVRIINDYNDFMSRLPDIIEHLSLDIDNLSFNDYCYIVEEAIKAIL